MLGGRSQLHGKFCGALVGGAIGDTLGAPFTGSRTVSAADMAKLEADTLPLSYTGNTLVTLAVADSLVGCGTFDVDHMAATMRGAWMEQRWRGYGAGLTELFQHLEAGVSWDDARRLLYLENGSQDSGAAVRVGPAALFTYDDLGRVASLARRVAGITHTHELGKEGAVVQACAIAYLLQQSNEIQLDVRKFLLTLRGLVGSIQYCQRLDWLIALPFDIAPEQVIEHLGRSDAAINSVTAALYAFLQYPADYVAAVTLAVMLGGETAAVGALTGALSGAFLGEQAIPPAWRARVEDIVALRERAGHLYVLAANGASIEAPRC